MVERARRHAIRALADRRLDSIALAATEGGWHELSIELRAHIVDPEDDTWCDDLIEYINGHPEVALHLEERRFHICRAHTAAREVIATGRVPATFTCPVANDRCPFEGASALVSGRALALAATLRAAR
jgi:hypothetical protein